MYVLASRNPGLSSQAPRNYKYVHINIYTMWHEHELDFSSFIIVGEVIKEIAVAFTGTPSKPNILPTRLLLFELWHYNVHRGLEGFMMIRFGMINIQPISTIQPLMLWHCSLGMDAPIDSCDSSKSAP